MPRASACNAFFGDFSTAERAENCPTCARFGTQCLGNDHPREQPAAAAALPSVPPAELYSMTVTLTNCHDTDGIASLAYNPGRDALAQAPGFRHHARNYAVSRGVTGYIQRVRHKDVVLVMEGTAEQLHQFNLWLTQCYGQGMFQGQFVESRVPIPFRVYNSFSIYVDHTRPFHPQYHPNGVIRGTWSETMYEKLSEWSQNLYRGGHSRSSGGGGSSYSQDSGGSGGGGGTGHKSSSRFMSAAQNIVGEKRRKL
eukprot:gene27628-33365_t